MLEMLSMLSCYTLIIMWHNLELIVLRQITRITYSLSKALLKHCESIKHNMKLMDHIQESFQTGVVQP